MSKARISAGRLFENKDGLRILGRTGHAVSVTKVASGNRELILEFDRDPRFHRGMAKHLRLRIPDRRLIECILKAIEAGWNPESRGKAFVFKAGQPSRH